MVPSVRFCLPSLLCYLKLVNKPDKSHVDLPVPFPRNVISSLLQWKDPSSVRWADACISGASDFNRYLCTALGRTQVPPRHESGDPWRNVSYTKCSETPWLLSCLWDISASVSERGWQRSQAEAPPRCCQRVSHTAPPFAPLRGAFPVLPLTLPLGGCVASCDKELTQLGSNPLSCQVCFQRAQKGTFLFIHT